MKKTLIALLALAGTTIASAYTLIDDVPEAVALKGGNNDGSWGSTLLDFYGKVKGSTQGAVYVGANNDTSLPDNSSSYELSTDAFDQASQTLRIYQRSAKNGIWYGSFTQLDLGSDVTSITSTVSFDLSLVDASQGSYFVQCGIIEVSSDNSVRLLGANTSESTSLSSTSSTGSISSTLTLPTVSIKDDAQYYSIFRVAGVNPKVSAATTYTNAVLKEWSVTSIPGISVPEPATATLSLLALAGLAGRRRRR
ncbi:MAG: PEP-CTERM sorting domain-containing protein [Akkermansia sp.]